MVSVRNGRLGNRGGLGERGRRGKDENINLTKEGVEGGIELERRVGIVRVN